ncbi:hypothetical protein [Streptomyces sp. NPDC046821]|uniref:hypothetical protein n=1 Tax=Streptomyces sp. NPDC046821 TaxID=3154702 RepID=UPI0033FC4611
MRYGVVVEELAVEVMAQLPDDRAWREVKALVEVAQMDPRAWPDVRDVGSVEEIRQAFGSSTCHTRERLRSGTSAGRADHFLFWSGFEGFVAGCRADRASSTLCSSTVMRSTAGSG